MPFLVIPRSLLRGGFIQLLDHLIRLEQDLRGDGDAEGLGGLQVDGQIELRRLLHRQVSRLGAFEDLIDMDSSASAQVRPTWAIRHKTASLHPIPKTVYRWQSILGREVHNPL